MMTVTLHEDAEIELHETLNYYAEQRPGLDGEFLREFESAIQRIREYPQLHAVEDDDGTRRCPLAHFPYSLVYIELENSIWVAAVAHQRRRPGYWARRRPGE